jgi:hypothetical protein
MPLPSAFISITLFRLANAMRPAYGFCVDAELDPGTRTAAARSAPAAHFTAGRLRPTCYRIWQRQ